MALSTKDILNEKKKTEKRLSRGTREPHNLVKSIIAIFVGLIFGFGIMALINVLDTAKVDAYTLVGAEEVTVYQGYDYLEDGIATSLSSKNARLSDPIYYNSNFVQISRIDTRIMGTYYAAYKLTNDYYTRTIYRKIMVVEEPPIEDIQIHFLELGNNIAGDAIYIKAGDNDILIDAGSTQASAGVISDYIDDFVGPDKTLEYVIATNVRSEHTSGFTSSSESEGIFDLYDVKTIIDFPKTNRNANDQDYQAYVQARDAEKVSGATHYTALQCVSPGGTKEFNLGYKLSMTVLNNSYYSLEASSEGDYSVCLLFQAGDKKFLFTGDLTSNGESRLITKNSIIEDVDLYKASDHGGSTGNSEAFLNFTNPKNIVVQCVAGDKSSTSIENLTYPTQAFINIAGLITENIYVTSMTSSNLLKYESLNGNIVFTCLEGNELSLNCSNNNFVLRNSNWFSSANRTWPTS